MAAFRLLRLGNLVLRVRDRQAMQRFYCDVLGCTLERVQEDLGRAGPALRRHGRGPSVYLSDPEGNTVELKGPPQA